jgi:CheY-like chemotaxis protein/nitrogen-specific signal transduction histidine kinase
MNGEEKKIIVVDDMPENLSAIKNILKEMYMVYPCPSAAKMFELLEHVFPDLILLDVIMPEMDGYETLKKLKSSQYSEIPVIFLTSVNDPQSEIKGLELGAIDYIRKPFVTPLLLQRIKTHLLIAEQKAEIATILEFKTEEVKLREMAELEAENASRTNSDFLSHLSREIRSPLNAVIGMINIAKEEKDPIEVKAYLEKAGNAAKHILGTINSILDLPKVDMPKIETYKLELSDSEFDLGKVMANIVDVTNARAQEKHIQVEVNVSPDIPSMVICDELRLAQVIINLMNNAIKFTPDNGLVQLNAQNVEEKDDKVTIRIEVVSNGIGLSPEQQEKLFSDNNQADLTVAKQSGDTGSGLAISKRNIELMQGKIWIESQGGKGAKFIFTLKMKKGEKSVVSATAESTPAPVPIIKASDLHLSGYTILAAEDMDFHREVLSMYLKDTGVAIDYVENGKQVVEKFKANNEKYCLILMDIRMPEMNGDEATKLIRALDFKKAREIPIIAMTADAFKEDVEKCMSAGMNDHISKPVVPKIIYAKLKQHLGL